MATVANSAYLSFGSNGSISTPVNRSTYFKSISQSFTLSEQDATTFGNSGNMVYEPGLKDSTISVEGNWDATINTHLYGIYNGQDKVSFEYGPDGNDAGKPKYSGTFFVTGYEPGASVGEIEAFSASFRVTGAVTLGTFS